MHNDFPADHELLAFFGVEPKVLDQNVPWFYNTLDFEVARDGFLVQCRLAPAYGDIDVRLHLAGTELARLNLQPFKSLKLYVEPGREILVATGQQDETFSLMLKPRVWIGFGNFPTGLPG